MSSTVDLVIVDTSETLCLALLRLKLYWIASL